MINLAMGLERGAQLHPGKPAVFFADRVFTYGQLDAAANRVANGLRALGIGRGDNVALACPNVPYFPIVYYGILKAGATVVPVSVLSKAPEIAYHLEDSRAKAFFCFEGSAELPLGKEGHAGFTQCGACPHFFMITADPAKPCAIDGVRTLGAFMQAQPDTGTSADTDANDAAVILYTSGTTGKPKGAELTHANMAMNAFVSGMITQMVAADCHLVALPLFHSFGQSVQMNAGIWRGCSMVLLPRFDPDAALAAMQKHKVTIFAGVPTMYQAILNLAGAEERHDLKSIAANLRVGVSGGAAMPVEVMRRFEERFGIAILEGYGLSETSPVATFSFLDFPRVPGSVGKPVWGTQVRVVDESGAPVPTGQPGEIVIRGHNVMKGYFRRPEATAQAIRDGWFHTGDIGRVDPEGNFYIVDRLKDMIIRGGFNVYPREIEEVMMTHEAIAQVAVIGVPHETHGEEVKAVVVLRAGKDATPEAIVAWCKERMAAYKYPRIVQIVESLPMTATGKILKRALKQ
ncbi:MAG TPA: long-chain fatty acid--CoA ligase [Usitatibacteraceae bacterium]|nr:long-chain fatty acid--CoA ligase [Usitatibacteraceae bacterium]